MDLTVGFGGYATVLEKFEELLLLLLLHMKALLCCEVFTARTCGKLTRVVVTA
jgi:hypothetical protein